MVFEVLRIILICYQVIANLMLIGGVIFCIAKPEEFREDVKRSEPIRMISVLFDLIIDSEHMSAYIVLFFTLNIIINILGIVAAITVNLLLHMIVTILVIPFSLMTFAVPILVVRISFAIVLILGWNKKPTEDRSDERMKNLLDKLHK